MIAFNPRHLLSRSLFFLSPSSLCHPHRTLGESRRLSTSGVSGHGSRVVDGALTPGRPRVLPQAPLLRLWMRPASTGCTLISRSLPILLSASPAVVPVLSCPHVPTQSSCSWFQPGVHVSAFTPLSRVPYSTCLHDVTPHPENSPTAESEPVPCSSCHRS